MAITFPVSEVALAERAPAIIPFASMRERLGVRDVVAAGGPESLVDGPVVPAFVLAAHVAFSEHRPLVLSPDDVWFTVLQGVAAHVALHAAELRDRFVSHEGQLLLEIRRDDLAPAADPPGDWATVPSELAAQALARSGPAVRALRVDLSTTDRYARVAMDVALLEALQSYFTYSVSSLCGIPSVTLLGEPADWATLVERVGALEGLGLDAWLEPLREVLVEMHRAASGRVDRAFWKALYKPEWFSGGDLVVGWVNVLFPYARDGSTLRDVADFLPRNLPACADVAASWIPDSGQMPLKPSEFPASLARAPFTWKLLGAVRAMELVAGHAGVGFDASTGAVGPRFAWWIGPRAPARQFVINNPTSDSCSMSPRNGATLPDLTSLGQEAQGLSVTSVNLFFCSALESLEGIASVPALENVRLVDCARISTLAPIAGIRSLRNLHITQCPGIKDVTALAALTSLETVCLMDCPEAKGIAGIGHLPHLRRAVLWAFPGIPERFQRDVHEPEAVRALQAWLREHPEV
jgi:hypothetical protein